MRAFSFVNSPRLFSPPSIFFNLLLTTFLRILREKRDTKPLSLFHYSLHSLPSFALSLPSSLTLSSFFLSLPSSHSSLSLFLLLLSLSHSPYFFSFPLPFILTHVSHFHCLLPKTHFNVTKMQLVHQSNICESSESSLL